MKYRRADAKTYARAHMKGIWAAALQPFGEDLSIDETGMRANIRHWIEDLGWRLYLCSSPPYLLQSAVDRRMRRYTDLAFSGRAQEARRVRDSLQPVRRALEETRPGGKPHAHQKYWQELLGQTGGPVRPPMLNLTEAEKSTVRQAFEECGLELSPLAAE